MRVNYSSKILIALLFFVYVWGFSGVSAQELDSAQSIATHFHQMINGKSNHLKNYLILNRNEKSQNYVFNFEEGGYVMVSGESNEVIAFSDDSEYNLKEIESSKIIGGDYIDVNEFIQSVQLKSTVQTAIITNQIDPFLTDVWGGVNCKDDNGNSVYPTNYYTPSHCSPGCVAISMGQVLHYYEWPLKGVGNQIYGENYNGLYKRHQAFFDNTEYDWNNMLDEYMNKSSTELQQKAVGELIYHIGVSLQMDYEPTGSTSNIDKTPFVYENFFRFTSHYENIFWINFWTRLYDNIQQGRPVPIAVKASRTGDGHVFVANGYKEIDGKPYYHINWGWYNNNGINGWYNISSWTESSPGYNTITGAAFDVLPNPQITSIVDDGSGDSFVVNWKVSEKLRWQEFTLEQKVDEGNWQEIATGLTTKSYTVNNPTGELYQFRVKAMVDGNYYLDSWSEVELFAVQCEYNGYVNFGGSQYSYARQTPDYNLDFTNDYTFDCWIRVKPGNVDGNVILNQENVFTIELTDVTSTNFAVKFKSYSSGYELISDRNGSKISYDEWVHVAVSKVGNISRLFINGASKDDYSGLKLNLVSSNKALNIAEKWRGSYSSRIKADFDQLRISNTGRYSDNFNPDQSVEYELDENTVAYFTFQDIYKVRFKDEAHNLSVIVSNEPKYAEWAFEILDPLSSISKVELSHYLFSVYPNPVSTMYLSISYKGIKQNIGSIDFHLFDLAGRMIPVHVKSKSLNSWVLSLKDIEPGTYLLQMKGNDFSISKKIIVY